MKKSLMIVFCLAFFGCNQNGPTSSSYNSPPEKEFSFLAGLEIKNLPSLAQIHTIEIAPIKPIKKVKNRAEVVKTGPAKILSRSEKAFFKDTFCRKENFNFKIKKKCLFIAEFMITFEHHKDFTLFISLSTNQMQILNKNEYQIIDFSTAFENSEGIDHLRSLLTLETKT